MKKIKKNKEIKLEKVQYFPDAKVKCSCGAVFCVGSTQENISVEVCSECHPFYTGNQKLVDSSGRVDKFKERILKQKEMMKNLKPDAKNTKEEIKEEDDSKKKESK